jgi:threonine/homoserine/homoserine lactone efflux protein
MARGVPIKEVPVLRGRWRRREEKEMLLLILEILATVKAWKKGWRKRALVPWGVMFGIAFLGGVVLGANGTNPTDSAVLVLGTVLEVINLIVLSIMAFNAPAPKPVPVMHVVEPRATEESPTEAVHA